LDVEVRDTNSGDVKPFPSAGRFIRNEAAGGLISAVALTVAGTIIGWARGWSWEAYLALGVIASCLVVVWYLYRSLQRLRRDTQREQDLCRESATTLARLTELDVSLLNALSSVITAPDRDDAIKNVLQEFLRECSALFGPDANRAYILRPMQDRVLRPWVAYQMPPETLNRTWFIASHEQSDRLGVAGQAFILRKLIVTHMVEEGERWKADNDHYVVFEPRRPHPPYRSFVSVPLSVANDAPCLGVVCFDSMNPTLFDPVEVQDLALALGLRIAQAITMHEALANEGRN
jgi:hypothetical protein